MQLEPIHISFTGGSRGEYLSSVVYTAYFKKLHIYEINDAGKMRISNEPNISKLHKTFPRIDKITEEKFLKVMSAQKITPLIGISHYVDELQNLFDKNFDKNCYVVKLLQKSPVIIIEYDEDDIPSIAIQSSIKNGEKTYEKKHMKKKFLNIYEQTSEKIFEENLSAFMLSLFKLDLKFHLKIAI